MSNNTNKNNKVESYLPPRGLLRVASDLSRIMPRHHFASLDHVSPAYRAFAHRTGRKHTSRREAAVRGRIFDTIATHIDRHNSSSSNNNNNNNMKKKKEEEDMI